MHVACACDENYAPHAAAMMHSLLAQHRPGEICMHLLHAPDLSRSVIADLRGVAMHTGGELHDYAIGPERVAALPDMGRISRVMWYRIFLPELLPQVSRVLYLDCDTLVMDRLDELFATELGGDWIAAVGNVFERGKEARLRELGIGSARQYFNSGVLLLDLDAWRREDCTGRILATTRDPKIRLVWPDQDALNLALAGRWHALHPRWNCQNSLFYFAYAREVFGEAKVREAIRRPGILHFEGGELAKPWHYLCKHPYRREYYRHLGATPWPVQPPEGRTLRNRLLRPLPMRWLLPALNWSQRIENALKRRLPGTSPAPQRNL